MEMAEEDVSILAELITGTRQTNKADKKILTTPSSIVVIKVIYVLVPN